MYAESPSVLRRFFSGISEYTFGVRLGMADPPLIDYISDLLTRFVRHDVIYHVRDPSGQRLQDVHAMLGEAQERVGDARREVHRHIGDYTLFWSGVYPETLRGAPTPRRGGDPVVDYQEEGKRAYWIASTIQSGSQVEPPADVLERLSRNFEVCAFGLREIRSEWERRDVDDRPPPPLLLGP